MVKKKDINMVKSILKYYSVPFIDPCLPIEDQFIPATNEDVIANEQGHYSLLSSIYFGGTATETLLTTEQTGQWIDVILTIDPLGIN